MCSGFNAMLSVLARPEDDQGMLKTSQVSTQIKVILSVESISTWVGAAHKSIALTMKDILRR